MEILSKWNCNFHSNQKKWSTSEGRLFVPENFHLSRAFHLHFNQLDWKFWLNEKHSRLRSVGFSALDVPPGLQAPVAKKTGEQMVYYSELVHFEPTDSFQLKVHFFLVYKKVK